MRGWTSSDSLPVCLPLTSQTGTLRVVRFLVWCFRGPRERVSRNRKRKLLISKRLGPEINTLSFSPYSIGRAVTELKFIGRGLRPATWLLRDSISRDKKRKPSVSYVLGLETAQYLELIHKIKLLNETNINQRSYPILSFTNCVKVTGNREAHIM